MAGTVRILGSDPGSVRTGYGIVDSDGRASRYVAHGCIAVAGDSLAERLGMIYRELARVIAEHGPAEMGIEEVFLARNPMAALKLGQARGAAICAGVEAGLLVAEYSARSIKQNVVGTGGAAKQQVQHMVSALLTLEDPSIQSDAADALAVALCHAHARTRPVTGMPARRRRSVRWK